MQTTWTDVNVFHPYDSPWDVLILILQLKEQRLGGNRGLIQQHTTVSGLIQVSGHIPRDLDKTSDPKELAVKQEDTHKQKLENPTISDASMAVN